jgi:hypothetical protein
LKRKLEKATFASPDKVMMKVNTILNKIPLKEFILVFDK